MTEMDRAKISSDVQALSEFNRGIVEQFRATGGAVEGLPGGELLLLHTTGARSGKSRMTPLAYLTVGDKTLIIGSSLGSSKDPAWVHNLRANPRATVEIGTDSFSVLTRELPSDERDAVYPDVIELAPIYAEYQAGTARVIPIFEVIRT